MKLHIHDTFVECQWIFLEKHLHILLFSFIMVIVHFGRSDCMLRIMQNIQADK